MHPIQVNSSVRICVICDAILLQKKNNGRAIKPCLDLIVSFFQDAQQLLTCLEGNWLPGVGSCWSCKIPSGLISHLWFEKNIGTILKIKE